MAGLAMPDFTNAPVEPSRAFTASVQSITLLALLMSEERNRSSVLTKSKSPAPLPGERGAQVQPQAIGPPSVMPGYDLSLK